ncbi:MAG: TetR family transcriptional regulator, partial [Leifsonia sp.]
HPYSLLFVQVVAGQWARASEDITARARLRDAAIECFALRGFDASVREIAARAGVSAGLVRHHFGTKDALRAECDAEVIRRYRDLKVEGIRMSPTQTMAALSQLDDFAPMFVYILRSVRDGGPVGREFIESMIAEAEIFSEDAVREGLLKPSRDPAARARYLVTSSLGGLLVQLTLMPDLDLSDIGSAIRRLTESITLPTLELYTEGVLADRSVLDEYLAHSPGPPSVRDDEPTPA